MRAPGRNWSNFAHTLTHTHTHTHTTAAKLVVRMFKKIIAKHLANAGFTLIGAGYT